MSTFIALVLYSEEYHLSDFQWQIASIVKHWSFNFSLSPSLWYEFNILDIKREAYVLFDCLKFFIQIL